MMHRLVLVVDGLALQATASRAGTRPTRTRRIRKGGKDDDNDDGEEEDKGEAS
jgi:hypothetical protein|eukprot:evm.model.NODE_33762_length_2416_cov_46.678806.1